MIAVLGFRTRSIYFIRDRDSAHPHCHLIFMSYLSLHFSFFNSVIKEDKNWENKLTILVKLPPTQNWVRSTCVLCRWSSSWSTLKSLLYHTNCSGEKNSMKIHPTRFVKRYVTFIPTGKFLEIPMGYLSL